ncbi:MAG: hypothetical protein LBF80_03360 [Spirochaetaceae bacterium]|nr:hypothetical protein [Spirochaetaceae bacterium]
MKNKINRITIFLAIAVLGGCGDGVVPTLKSYTGDDEVDKIRLPEYGPPAGSVSWGKERYGTYGTRGTRINPEDLYIKNAYRTSDDVIHIVLSGKITNGIPEGLVWNEDTSADFGAPSGSYSGRGDFRIRTTGGTGAANYPDFSTEWVSAGLFTAVTLEGLVDGIVGTTIIEKNESLNLLSDEYRDKFYPEAALYASPGGRLQKNSTYTYNPNNFRRWPEPSVDTSSYWTFDGDSRGGYAMLISKSENAASYTAVFDITYPDGAKKRVEVDYSDVQLRESVN